MDQVAVILAAVAVVAVVVAFVVRWWTWRPLVARRAFVQTDADVSFDGIVVARRGQLIVLADVTVHAAGTAQRVDGRVVIERARVQWVQVR